MDCEKFESTVLDELYEELDELTSAASKRHVAGCSRCAGLLAGLRATRRVAVLPLVAPPPDLEERILAAARDAQKVVPLRGRVAKVVSLAGSWAMRPQTAMAAVFLLMVGTSALFLHGQNRASAPAGASMVVSERGSPAASAASPPEQDQPGDLTAAANAHGVEQKVAAAPVATMTAEPAASANNAYGNDRLALADKDTTADSRTLAPSLERQEVAQRGAMNAAAPAGAPVPAALPAAQAPGAAAETQGTVAGGAQQQGATFTDAMTAYRNKSYDTATREFDALAAAGDPNAALWAARSVRESAGCASAVSRFDQVAARSFGNQAGYDATLEGGRCYKAMGSFDAARTRFVRLLTVPSHAARAQAELDAMTPRGQMQQPMRAPARAAKPAAVDSQGY